MAVAFGRAADSSRTWDSYRSPIAHSYTITTAYNAAGRATLSADPDGNQTLTCYDGDGNATQMPDPVVALAAAFAVRRW